MNNISPARDLSRREIKGFAAGLAFKFFCSAEHYAWMAYHHQVSDVHIDLLTLQIEPVLFDIDRNRNLAQLCKDTLLGNISLLRAPGMIIAAKLDVCFGIDRYISRGVSGEIGKSIFKVTLKDDRGKDWTASYVDDAMLACK